MNAFPAVLGCAIALGAQPQPAGAETARDSPIAAPPAASTAARSGTAAEDGNLRSERTIATATISFASGSAVLSDEARAILAQLFVDTAAEIGATIRIEGHCDERGSAANNLALGQRRADAAQRFLIWAGASPDRITAVSLGTSRPKARRHDPEAWRQNRRVDVVVLAPAPLSAL